MLNPWVGVNPKRNGIYQFNSNIWAGIWIESFGTKLIKMELNEKELSILSFCDAAKDILQIVGCIAAQAMVFNDLNDQ